jgi:hypothetical protein
LFHKESSSISLALYTAALRVVILPWNEPPQAVESSFTTRLGRGEGLASVLKVPPEIHQQACFNQIKSNQSSKYQAKCLKFLLLLSTI